MPDGMLRAKEIVCERSLPGQGDRLAIHYLFSSSAAARRWLREIDLVLNDKLYGWWLHGRTLTGAVDVDLRRWQLVVVRLRSR